MRTTRGSLVLPDATQTPPNGDAPAEAATPADGVAPSASPSPVATLRPAHPPERYPRLTTHAGRGIVSDRAHDPGGFYGVDSLTPAPAEPGGGGLGMLPRGPGDGALPSGESAAGP
jgi:hypothetical protein